MWQSCQLMAAPVISNCGAVTAWQCRSILCGGAVQIVAAPLKLITWRSRSTFAGLLAEGPSSFVQSRGSRPRLIAATHPFYRGPALPAAAPSHDVCMTCEHAKSRI